MARRGSVPLERLNLAALAQQSPCFRRGLEIILGPDAGTEQWYTTIAKLMQGRNANIPHSLANLRCGVGTPVPLRHPQSEIVATWLILPVVICLS